MLERKLAASAQSEKERKLAKRYHHVKFFEKKRCSRRLSCWRGAPVAKSSSLASQDGGGVSGHGWPGERPPAGA